MFARAVLTALLLSSATGCGDDGGTIPKDAAPKDATTTPDASCFENPQTHLEIINACTDAQQIYKDSHPPLLEEDGSLPPLP